MILKVAGAVLLLNLVAFLMFAWDKYCAKRGRWRVSERTLLFTALVGGSAGALAAQQWLRHKSYKEPFRSRLFAIVALHVFLIIAAVALSIPESRDFLMALVSGD